MIFSRTSMKKTDCIDVFKLGNFVIDTVQEYKYLGVVFSNNGSFKVARDSLDK